MDIVTGLKIFSTTAPVIKGLLSREDVDLGKEIEDIRLLSGSLPYVADKIASFNNTLISLNEYFSSSGDRGSEPNLDEFVAELVSVFALLSSSKFLFKQANFGKYIELSIDGIMEEVERIPTAIKSEGKDKISMIVDGSAVKLEEVIQTISQHLQVLEMHQEHWRRIFSNTEAPTELVPENMTD